MQPGQVKVEFPRIEQHIDNAAQLCQISKDVPEETDLPACALIKAGCSSTSVSS